MDTEEIKHAVESEIAKGKQSSTQQNNKVLEEANVSFEDKQVQAKLELLDNIGAVFKLFQHQLIEQVDAQQNSRNLIYVLFFFFSIICIRGFSNYSLGNEFLELNGLLMLLGSPIVAIFGYTIHKTFKK